MLRRLGTNKKSLVIVPLALTLALTWLFLPVKEVSIEPYGTLSLESRVVITTGYQAAYAAPDTERQSPDALMQTNLTGAVSDIQDDPDNLPDANWLTAVDHGLDTVCRVSFPTPTGNPTTGAGSQNFKIWVKRSTALSTPTVYMDLYESGGFIANTSLTATSVTSDSGELFTGTWDAGSLGTEDGSAVEAYVYGTKAGSAASTNWVTPTSEVLNGWGGAGNAWDEDTGTSSSYDVPKKNTWSPYLELYLSETSCNSVRIWSSRATTDISDMEVDVYYLDAWNTIHTGSFVGEGAFYTFAIGDTQSVTGMRVRYFNSLPNAPQLAYFHEADFGQVIPATYSSVDIGAVEWNVDYTPEVPAIINDPTSINFGNVTTSTDYWSNGSAPTFSLDDAECFFEVTNNSSQAVNIAIRSTDFSGGAPGGWTLGATAGENIVVLKAGASGTGSEGAMVVLETGDQPFISNLLGLPSAPDNIKKWELKMETPTVFGNTDVKTAMITLTAAF